MLPARLHGLKARRRLLAGLVAAALLALPGLSLGAARGKGLSQWRVQAAYLLKFTQFVTWPADSPADENAPLRIGVAGSPQMLVELQALAKSPRGDARPVQVQAVGAGDPVDGLHVLFVGTATGGQGPAWLGAAMRRPILTVTDDARLHANGSMVNFVMDDRRVRFDVSLPAIERGGLQVSALMLTAAREVVRGQY